MERMSRNNYLQTKTTNVIYVRELEKQIFISNTIKVKKTILS